MARSASSMTAVFTQYDEVGSSGSRDGLVPDEAVEPGGEVIEVALVGSSSASDPSHAWRGRPARRRDWRRRMKRFKKRSRKYCRGS